MAFRRKSKRRYRAYRRGYVGRKRSSYVKRRRTRLRRSGYRM
jgi:hypothetical protein